MPGNPSSFDALDVIRCFLALKETKSRGTLTGELRLGEGSVRALLNILKEKKLIISSKEGHVLSEKGNRLHETIKRTVRVSTPTVSTAFMEAYFPACTREKVAVAELPRQGNMTMKTYALRDMAVKERADGVLIVQRKNGKLSFPEQDYGEDLQHLERIATLKEDGVIIVVVAENHVVALRGLLNILCRMTGAFAALGI